MIKKIDIYDKYYYEKLAKETLRNFVNKSYDLFIIDDRPDLQYPQKGIGIEVTRSITSYQGLAQAFCNMYFIRENSTEFLNRKMKEMKIKYGMILTDEETNLRAFCAYKGTEDLNMKKNLVAKHIDKKIDLFKTYDKNFQNKQVYIFCGWAYEDHDIAEIVCSIININELSKIYFDCMNKLFIYDTTHKKLDVFVYDNKLYTEILDRVKKWRIKLNNK